MLLICNCSGDQECTNENFDDDIPAVIDVEEFINVGFKNSTESGTIIIVSFYRCK